MPALELRNPVPASGTLVPRGPVGLWDALTRSGAEPTVPSVPSGPVLSSGPVLPAYGASVTDGADVVELSSVAHLGYLARLAPTPTWDEPSADVVDLDAYRSRRSA